MSEQDYLVRRIAEELAAAAASPDERAATAHRAMAAAYYQRLERPARTRRAAA